MYCAGHLLSSMALSVAIARRRRVNYVAMAALTMAAQVFDLDHVFNHQLDDGTGNSLLMHPLHMYFGLVAMGLIIGGLIDRPRFDYWFGVLAALCLHITLDAAAAWVHYDLRFLAAADAAMILLIPLLAWRWPVGPRPLTLGLFALAMAAVCSGIQAFMHYRLGLRLERDLLVIIVPAAMSVLSGLVFWLIFRVRSALARA